MKFATHKYPRGATSLLVVVGLAMLLLVIVTGLTVLSIRESRQALNTDLSNRALAAATATAQDAAQLLNANPNLQVPSCDPASTASQDRITGLDNNPNHLTATDIETPTLSNAADNQTSIQCRTIKSVASTFTQELKYRDKSSIEFLTYLPSNTPVTRMKLLWGDGTTDVSSFSTSPFPSVTAWPRLTPAAMEITLVFWPKVAGQPGNVAAPPADGLPVRTVVLLPTQTQTSQTDPSPSSSTVSGVSCGGGKAGVLGGTFSCSSDISLSSILGGAANAANYNIVVKLKARYIDNTPIQVQFLTGTTSATPVDIQSSIATIDITAKVGDLYRRIQAQKPVGSNSFIDDVLYSKAKVCKNLVVKQDYGLVSDNVCP